MDLLGGISSGFQTALSLQNVYLCFIGCLFGTMVGVLTFIVLLRPSVAALYESAPLAQAAVEADHEPAAD